MLLHISIGLYIASHSRPWSTRRHSISPNTSFPHVYALIHGRLDEVDELGSDCGWQWLLGQSYILPNMPIKGTFKWPQFCLSVVIFSKINNYVKHDGTKGCECDSQAPRHSNIRATHTARPSQTPIPRHYISLHQLDRQTLRGDNKTCRQYITSRLPVTVVMYSVTDIFSPMRLLTFQTFNRTTYELRMRKQNWGRVNRVMGWGLWLGDGVRFLFDQDGRLHLPGWVQPGCRAADHSAHQPGTTVNCSAPPSSPNA